MVNFSSYLNGLNSPNSSERTRCFSFLLNSARRLDSSSGARRRIVSKASRIDSAEASLLIKALNSNNDPILDLMRECSSDLNIEPKEFSEVFHFYNAVQPILREYGRIHNITDLCAGNGLNGLYWFLKEGRIVDFIDLKDSKYFDILKERLSKYFPEVQGLSRKQRDINFLEDIHGGAYISIHACGKLTDRVIDLSIKNRVPFAVMPCCYEKEGPLPEDITMAFTNLGEITDILRIKKCLDRDYNIKVRRIPKEVTPMNRILIGLPK